MITKTKVFEAKNKIRTDRTFALKVTKAIWAEQVRIEKETEETIFKNRVGFNKNDAPVLSEICKRSELGWFLSDLDYKSIQARLVKYAHQYLKLEQAF